MTTPQTAAIAPMDLSRQPGAFTDEGVCRNLRTTPTLQLARRAVTVGYGRPATPWAPLTVTSNARLRVRIDGQGVGTGQTVIISPRTLSSFADGAHMLQVNGAGHSAHSQLLLAPCVLAARLDGGPRQTTTLSASARAGMNSLTFHLPRGLDLYLTAHRKLGSATFKPAGYPTRSFDLVGSRTTSNNVTVSLTTRTVRVTNLPVQVGVVHITLRPGVLGGRG